jgi:hypothetical protein
MHSASIRPGQAKKNPALLQRLQSRLAPSGFTDDEPRGPDVIRRIKAPIQAVSDLVDEFVLTRTIPAFDDDGIGAFQGIPDKDVDDFPHRTTPLDKNHGTAVAQALTMRASPRTQTPASA